MLDEELVRLINVYFTGKTGNFSISQVSDSRLRLCKYVHKCHEISKDWEEEKKQEENKEKKKE